MKKSSLAAPLFFLLLSGLLVFCWFRFGHIYGGGDTGLPTLNPKVMANIARYIWWDSLAPGIPVAQGITSVPTLFFLAIPQILGAGSVFIQSFLFFILLFLMGYGMYLLAVYIFGKSSYLLAASAGVFYMFNPYMMIQVWHRFIYNAMFFVAFLPFLVWTWLLWIRKRNFKYLLLFLIVNFLAVYIYGTIAFIVGVWMLLFVLTLLEALTSWQGKNTAIKLFTAFFAGFILWLLTNSWWLIPTFSVSPAQFAQVHSTDDNLSTLRSLSDSSVLPYILRLINPFYLYWEADFGNIYHHPFFLIVSWLLVIPAFVGFIRALKQKAYVIWGLLLLVFIYLSKGAAPPFNYPFIWGFSHFFPLGVIRNPFEKLGVILPFIYAILFALGLQYLFSYFTKTIGRPLTVFLLIVFTSFHMAFFWPMFAGKLFGNLKDQNYVEVPKSYFQTDDWIRKDVKEAKVTEGRVLHLPLPRSEDVTYKWPYGYHGVEPSAAIFTTLPSIARGLDIPGVRDALSGLSNIFHQPYAGNQAVILKMLQDFNIKYILLHKDIQWLGRDISNPLETELVLDRLEFLEKKEVFGDLTIYKIKDSYFSQKIIISDDINLLFPSQKTLFWPWMVATSSAQLITITNNKDVGGDNLDIKTRGDLLFSEDSFNFKQALPNSLKDSVKNLLNTPGYTGASLNNLIQIKNALIQQTKDTRSINLAQKIIASSELILNLYSQQLTNHFTNASLLQNEYIPQIRDIFKDNLRIAQMIPYGREEDIANIFQMHYFVLSELVSQASNLKKPSFQTALDTLKDLLTKNKVITVHPLDTSSNGQEETQKIIKFQVNHKSDYEILMTDAQVSQIYANKIASLPLWVNGKSMTLNSKTFGNLLSFGNVELDNGLNEIGYSMISSQNLLPDLQSLNLHGDIKIIDNSTIQVNASDKESIYFDTDINGIYGDSQYRVSLDTFVNQGTVIFIQMLQDTDTEGKIDLNPLRNGIKDVPVSQFFLTSPNASWQNYSIILPYLRFTTQKAKLRIALYSLPVKDSLNNLNPVLIKNLRVDRVLDNSLILREINQARNSLQLSAEVSNIRKFNSSTYEGRIKLDKPAILVFKETFHPDWQLELSENQNKYFPQQHYLGNLYANAWLVEKAGDYNFKIEFEPQKFVNLGIVITMLAYAGSLILLLSRNKKT